MGLEDKEYEVKELLSGNTFKINGKDPRIKLSIKSCDVKIFNIQP